VRTRGGADLPTTVMPFIIRAVRLQGVEAVMAPIPMREVAWAASRPTSRLRRRHDHRGGALSELLDRGPTILDGQVRGRWSSIPTRDHAWV